MPLMRDMFDFTPVSSWVENFNESTHDETSRARIFQSFVLLPEVEDSARIILDRVQRRQGRGFFVTGLYGSGKTIFMAWLSAILTEPTLRKQFLDSKPEWGMDALASRKFLTINFTAIEVPEETLEEAFWHSVTYRLRNLSPPVTATLSNTDAYLDTFFNRTAAGTRSDVEKWIQEQHNQSLEQMKQYDKEYQKSLIERAVSALNIQLVEERTTVTEKVKKLVEIANSQGYEGVHVFIDELYLHLIQSDEHFNQGIAFLGQLAEAGLAGDQPFWVFGAVQEEIQAIARQAGRNYSTELMGRLSGQSGRFQSINIPVTQFHRIYNHRLFRPNSKKVHVLAETFKAELQPHYRGTFTEFFRRYFREREPVTDESRHFGDVYPMHPFALYCLTVITNRGGRSRGALGFVQEFIERCTKTNTDWKRLAVLDDVFDYEDLRNKIVSDDPEMQKYYGMFEHFCSSARDEVLARTPYRRWDEKAREFAKQASERLVKALIVLSMVKEELGIPKLNDALLLRWPGQESNPAGSDAETIRLLDKIANTFSPLRKKGSDENPTFFLSMEGDGGEREELLFEVESVVNGFGDDIQTESAYRSHLELFLRFPGSPLGGTIPPGHGFSTQVEIDWQRTRRSIDYRLESVAALSRDHQVVSFIKDVPPAKALHIVIIYPSTSPLDVEMDQVRYGNPRTLVWLPGTLPAQDFDEIKRSMALVKLYGDYQSQINVGGASQSVRRKFDLLKECLDIPAGQTDVQPGKAVVERLQSAFIEGEIRLWNAKDQVWEILCEPAELLAHYNSITQNERSLGRLLEKVGGLALTKVFDLHPDFRNVYSFTADLSGTMRKRVLEAIWKGLVTDEDGHGKPDLERFLAPLGLLDTSVPGAVSVTLSAGSVEAFRKARERIRDNIRKAETQSTSMADTRKRLKTTDVGLTDTWVDILIALLISTGEISGYTINGKVVSQDDRSSVGSPVTWLQELDELRLGTRPDETLWHDLTQSLHIFGLWKEGNGYNTAAAERLLDILKQAEEESQREFNAAEQALQTWPKASVPDTIVEWTDLFALPTDARESRIACFNAFRDAMRDMLGLSPDDNLEAANRYTCVEDSANRLREVRDFLGRIAELSGITARLRELRALGLPKSIDSNCRLLLDGIETYVLSSGRDGELSTIAAEWKDLKDQYANQYLSEHSGLHRNLKELRDIVLNSKDYAFLKNLSLVDGLSAHYSSAEIELQLKQLLEKVQVTQVCGRGINELRADLENGWTCAECGYKPGKTQEFRSDKYLKLIQRGIKEFLDYLNGCADDIGDYVSNHTAAEPLLGLLSDPTTEEAKAALADDAVRQHLTQALVDASAVKVDLDDLLEKLKPCLLGFFKAGRHDFEKSVAEAISELLQNDHVAEEDQPWKVE